MIQKEHHLSIVTIFFMICNSLLYAQEQTMHLYKIVSPEQWEQSQSQTKIILTSFDEPFIHLAQEHQVTGVLQKFWTNQPHIVLTLDSTHLIGELKLERNRPEGDLYYHLYNGSIPLTAVISAQSSS